MTITGKGLIIVDLNGTINYFMYEDAKDLKDLVKRFNKRNIKDITIVDCDGKKLYFDYKEMI